MSFFAPLSFLRFSLSVTVGDWTLTGSLIIHSWFYTLRKVIRCLHLYSVGLCLILPFTEWVMLDTGEIMRLSKVSIPFYKGKNIALTPRSTWNTFVVSLEYGFNKCLYKMYKNTLPQACICFLCKCHKSDFKAWWKMFMFFLGKSHVSLMKKQRLWLMVKKNTTNEMYKN